MVVTPAPQLAMLLHIAASLAQVPLLGDLFIWSLQPRPYSGASAEMPYGGGGKP